MSSSTPVPVLMYHHVSPSADMITSSPAHFESQIAWLAAHGYHALSADEFARHLAGEPVPPRSVLITFDDGYLDNWLYASPVLQRHGMRAVMFLVTSWVHDGPARTLDVAQGALQTPPHRACKALIAEGRSDDVIVRWEEVQAMAALGTFEFHSHTHTHTRWDLAGLDADARRAHMVDELARSRTVLRERLGVDSSHLCWPQGYFDDEYVRLAGEAGYRHLYTTDAYGMNQRGGDPRHIYRLAVRNRRGSTVGRRIRLSVHPLLGPWYNRWKRRQHGMAVAA